MKQSLNIQQGQSLVMTQQLQQSIKLLQLSSAELSEFVAEEMEKNPLLTSDEEQGSNESAPQDDAPPQDSAPESSETTTPVDEKAIDMDDGNATKEMDANDEAVWGDGAEMDGDGASRYEGVSDYTPSSGGGDGSSFLADTIEQRVSEEADLREHLGQQIQMMTRDAFERLIAAHIIDLLDETGYLRTPLIEIADQLGCRESDVEGVLDIVHQCDPVGIGARNLKECMILQLMEKDRYDPIMQTMMDNLEMVELGQAKKLAKLCGVDEDELREMLLELRELNPYPGGQFCNEQVQTMVPDVYVRKGNNGEWKVDLNNETLPKVLINRRYHTTLVEGSRDKEEKKFLNEQLSNASWLVKALDQRANTLLKVSAEIVNQQRRFFDYGVRFIRPMTLAQIAEKIEMHESSVSRVTTNKYISTGRGTFELKYFFSSSLAGASGEGSFSSRSVMHMIKEMIEAEPAEKILSDDAIASKLGEKGIDVARRTVVKYRTKMKIGSSVQRRREKKSII